MWVRQNRLKNRVSSYFQTHITHPKTQALVNKIDNIEVIITNSEMEALLLEQNLIKSLKPPYNILLKDDKSYPYLVISVAEEFPQIYWQRGKKALKPNQRLFGPYPNSKAVLDALTLLQKTFRLRNVMRLILSTATALVCSIKLNAVVRLAWFSECRRLSI
jgi:excinuclease ABC subunit C